MCPLCAIFTLNALKYHVYMCIQAADDASLIIQKSAVCCCLLGVSGLTLHQLLLDKLLSKRLIPVVGNVDSRICQIK